MATGHNWQAGDKARLFPASIDGEPEAFIGTGASGEEIPIFSHDLPEDQIVEILALLGNRARVRLDQEGDGGFEATVRLTQLHPVV